MGNEIAQLTEVPGTGTEVFQNSQEFPVGIRIVPLPVPSPEYLLNENARSPGIWPPAYTEVNSGYGYESFTELTELPVRVIPRKTPRVRFCMYPTKHNLIHLNIGSVVAVRA